MLLSVLLVLLAFVAVVSAYDRIIKYEAKFDPAVYKDRMTQMKAQAADKFILATVSLKAMEDVVRSTLDTLGVPSPLVVFYLAFARQVWRAKQTYTGTAVDLEAAAYKAAWQSRGLDPAVMDALVPLI